MSTSEMLRREWPRKAGENEKRHLCRILRMPEVEAVTGKKKSAIYEDIAAGTFPTPVPIGPRAVGWLEEELAEWQAQQIEERARRRSRLLRRR
jgi:prophage regulatory protein